MPSIREIQRKEKPLSVTKLKKEHKNLLKAMDAIRFLSFKHDVGYWNDAKGTDAEKLNSILILARMDNWAHDGRNKTKDIVKKHK